MKVLAIIFTNIFVISIILFGLTFAATGIDKDKAIYLGFKGSGDIMELDKTFTDEFNNVEISIRDARSKISKSIDNTTRVIYQGTVEGVELDVKIVDDTLIIKEEKRTDNWLPIILININNAYLEVELPEKIYNSIDFSILSGDGEVDFPDAESLTIKTSSGKADVRGFADKIEISTLSGSSSIVNSGNKKSSKLTVSASSGKTSVIGFKADDFKATSLSGKLVLEGISGNGYVKVSSGSATLTYSEWNDDLDVSVMSGKATIYLPSDSGVSMTTTINSGSIKYDLENDFGKIEKRTGEITFGGTNKNKISANVSSGRLEIFDEKSAW